MSLSPETMIELMGLADGELEGEALARAQRLVATNDEARRIVEAMRDPALADWLQAEMVGRADAAGANGIADAVMAKVQASPSRAVLSDGAGRVVPLFAAPGAGGRRRTVVAVGATCLAVAAALALYVRTTRSSSEADTPLASADPSTRVDVAPSPVAQAAGGGVEVDEIDSPSHGVSVFEIPMGAAAAVGGSRASSVVIWIDDEPAGSK